MSNRIEVDQAVDVAISNLWLTGEDIVEYLTSCHAMRKNTEACEANKVLAKDIVKTVVDWLEGGDGFQDIGMEPCRCRD